MQNRPPRGFAANSRDENEVQRFILHPSSFILHPFHVRWLVATVILLLLAGCTIEAGLGQPQPPPAPGPQIADYPPLPEGLPRGRVVKVVDGDTIDVELDGREERVRLIGIDTPESVDPRRPVECFGREASDNAKALLTGQTVFLEDDSTQDSRDRNGRLLRYVWLEDGRLINLEQIVGGFAFEYTFDRPYIYRDQFRAAEEEARAAGAGLWAADTCGGQSIPADAGPPAATATAAPVEPGGGVSCRDETGVTEAPETPVRIVGVDKATETVRLENVSDAPVSLEGWLLCSVRGGEVHAGLSGALAPGEARDFANPGEPIWSNSNRDDAALYGPDGRLVSYLADA